MLTDHELDAICDSFVAANRAEFLDTDFDLPIQRAVETIVAQREAAAVKAALLSAADEMPLWRQHEVAASAWLRDRANRSEGGRVTVCDHPGIEHGMFSYTAICPSCGICKFVGHGPLCTECYEAAPARPDSAPTNGES